MRLSHADHKHLARAKRSGNRAVLWTDEQLLDAVRQADKDGFDTSPKYQEWANAPGRPTFRTLSCRFGSWAQARSAAGLSSARKGGWRWRTTDEQHLAAVVRCARSLRKLPTVQEYRDFRREKGEGAPKYPSDALVRSALGGWAHTLELVAAELEKRR